MSILKLIPNKNVSAFLSLFFAFLNGYLNRIENNIKYSRKTSPEYIFIQTTYFNIRFSNELKHANRIAALLRKRDDYAFSIVVTSDTHLCCYDKACGMIRNTI